MRVQEISAALPLEAAVPPVVLGFNHEAGSPPVASLGVRGRTAPGDTLQEVTPERKKLCEFTKKIVDKRGRTGEKGAW